jgi:hypothetical protein
MRCRSGLLLCLLAALAPLALSACADTLTSEETKSSSTLRRDYDKTLTKAEKAAAISELQNAKAKQQGGGTSGQTASAGAASPEKQE